jgi:hypothetical protein
VLVLGEWSGGWGWSVEGGGCCGVRCEDLLVGEKEMGGAGDVDEGSELFKNDSLV